MVNVEWAYRESREANALNDRLSFEAGWDEGMEPIP